ncbi:hypothetical protein BCR36DRAFT_369666 [Piromyces finnis]|uniref:Ras-domain-containing protein n=1 Tax=Piromyces finnis TaxID=1754191 RepID=A0A1Y1VB79_9FUNG|nr:hypothetical protein BCR36DRAFT_369666 [Piromyces finnis]|eukprot:ORX51754.1 hypothetical protein BCR36DRAFT_369666 [Piromyces finnis]
MKKGILKVVLIGDGGVGKTAIRVQYIHNRFTNNYKATIGADFITKEVQTEDGKRVSMQIWDTAGQERFQSLGIAYYRGADACIIVYDVTNPDSFKNVLSWEEEFINKADLKDPSTYPFILVGNKTDIEDERVITKSQGRRMAIKMREQSIKTAPHYGYIHQSKYAPSENTMQSYNDSLLAIYQRSSSYKRYSNALKKEHQNSKNDLSINTKSNITYTNQNYLNTENVEAEVPYIISNNNKRKQYNTYEMLSPLHHHPHQYEDDDDDSIDYEDYDDLKRYRIPYFEVSAKYGDNIEEAFNYIAKNVQLPQFEFLIEGDVIDWNDINNERNSKLKCCS